MKWFAVHMVRVLLDPPPSQALQEEAWTVRGCSSQTITGRKMTGTSFFSFSAHSVEQNRGENGDLLPPGPKEQIHRTSHPRGALSGEQGQVLARLLWQPRLSCQSGGAKQSSAVRDRHPPSGWRTSQYPQLPSLVSCYKRQDWWWQRTYRNHTFLHPHQAGVPGKCKSSPRWRKHCKRQLQHHAKHGWDPRGVPDHSDPLFTVYPVSGMEWKVRKYAKTCSAINIPPSECSTALLPSSVASWILPKLTLIALVYI